MNRTLMNPTLLATTAFVMLAGTCFAQDKAQTGQPSAPKAGMSGDAPSTPSAKPSGTQAQSGTAQSGQTGLRQVNPAAAVRLTYYTVQPADMRASNLIGSNVYNLNNEDIGEIEDLILDNGKTLKAVVVSVGGFLGIGDRNVAVEPNSLLITEQTDGSTRIVANTTKEELKNAPAFNLADVDKNNAANTTGSAPASGAATTKSTNPTDTGGNR